MTQILNDPANQIEPSIITGTERSSRAKTFALMQGTSCSGCYQNMLNLKKLMGILLPNMDIVYWSRVIDADIESLMKREDKSIDIGLFEGAIATKQDIINAKMMRVKCKFLVAFGTGSKYGSVFGLANQFDNFDLLMRKYKEADIISDRLGNMHHAENDDAPEMLENVLTLDQVVEVDAYLPGCPPKKENILGMLVHLSKSKLENAKKETNVCATCKAEPCLLLENKLCFGNITAGGCTTMCPNKGDNCTGCYGKTNNIEGDKERKLNDMLDSLKTASRYECNLISQFILLYHDLPPLGTFVLKKDPLRKLSRNLEIEINDDVTGHALRALQRSPNYHFSNGNVCSSCDRNGTIPKKMTTLKRLDEGIPNDEECFLNQGYICMGPATQVGCGGICPKSDSVCSGCYGPVYGIEDQGSRAISTIASLANVDVKEFNEKISDPLALFYRYTLATSIISKKVHEKEN
ncbi:MAG: hypothetical protein ACFFCS_08485 [Candidatus Hodarchaeota archaeon]